MSTEPNTTWGTGRLGALSEPSAFTVERERTIAYAQATNDEHPKHLAGELAPPVFAFVPVFQAMMPVIASVVPAGVLMRVVHGEHDFSFTQPIVPGMELVSRVAPVGIHGRSSGVTVVVRAVTETGSGEPVVEQHMTAFFRGAQLEGSFGDEAPPHGFPAALRGSEPLLSVTHGYDSDQTRRYAEAAGDPMPIHLDEDFARSVGLPGIIVHGMCTLAFASRAVIAAGCPDDPARLARLAGRFGAIVQPSEQVTTSVYDGLCFETVSGNGNTAIKDGLATLR